MTENTPPIRMSRDVELTVPGIEKAIPVAVSDWNHLKEMVQRIASAVGFFHSLGFLLLGIAGSALFYALSNLEPQNEREQYMALVGWAAFATAALSGGLSLYFSRKQRETDALQKTDVLKEMDRVEQRSGLPAGGMPKP